MALMMTDMAQGAKAADDMQFGTEERQQKLDAGKQELQSNAMKLQQQMQGMQEQAETKKLMAAYDADPSNRAKPMSQRAADLSAILSKNGNLSGMEKLMGISEKAELHEANAQVLKEKADRLKLDAARDQISSFTDWESFNTMALSGLTTGAMTPEQIKQVTDGVTKVSLAMTKAGVPAKDAQEKAWKYVQDQYKRGWTSHSELMQEEHEATAAARVREDARKNDLHHDEMMAALHSREARAASGVADKHEVAATRKASVLSTQATNLDREAEKEIENIEKMETNKKERPGMFGSSTAQATWDASYGKEGELAKARKRVEELRGKAKAARDQSLNLLLGVDGGAQPAEQPKPTAAPSNTPKTEFSGQDKAAADWAAANPNDPRAKAIMAKLGSTPAAAAPVAQAAPAPKPVAAPQPAKPAVAAKPKLNEAEVTRILKDDDREQVVYQGKTMTPYGFYEKTGKYPQELENAKIDDRTTKKKRTGFAETSLLSSSYMGPKR